MSNSAQVNTVDEVLSAPKLFVLGLQLYGIPVNLVIAGTVEDQSAKAP